MTRDPRYDILFEPVPIEPVVARYRLYQVPHCNGMGHRDPTALAVMRGVKAEGGWAVVCTEQVEVHPISEMTPLVEMRLWDDADIPAAVCVAELIHRHGALAGCELGHNGMSVSNFYSREVPVGPRCLPISAVTSAVDPVQARRMDKDDIRTVRRWHPAAALRARTAGFDLVYVNSGLLQCITDQFLSRLLNDRIDDYGGSLENRVRLLREMIEDMKNAVGDRCAVPVRLSTADLTTGLSFDRAEVEDLIGLIADLPDLFDFHLAGWEYDSRTSRFADEGHGEEFLKGPKQLTSKPVVAVGRYTSPDAMVRIVRQGLVDLVGAARPLIADPFLPRKVEEGRLDDVRECIGCSICVSGDYTMSPIRCTQNPSMGEELRRGWHPERIRPKTSGARVLVVGAGPAGLECARALGQRGYPVVLAETSDVLGGRVVREAALPGLGAWIRVRDHRVLQIDKMPNIELYRARRLDAAEVQEVGAAHVVIATGTRWRRDGIGRRHFTPISVQGTPVLTPDDLMDGSRPSGRRIVLFDDDHYYIGGVLAELLVKEGHEVDLVTTASEPSTWTRNTMEQGFIQARLLEMGVTLRTHPSLERVEQDMATLRCVFTGCEERVPADALVLVTARIPDDDLAHDLRVRQADWAAAGLHSVTAIADALAPATIAHAVYEGRRYAEEFDDGPVPTLDRPLRRELPALSPMP